MQNLQSKKHMLNMLKFVKYAEFAEYELKRPFQCTKSGTWISVLTSWKVRTTQLPHPNPLFSAFSATPGLRLAGLHFWRLCCTGSSPTDTIDSMPAAAPPSPEQFLPDLKRVSINKNGFNMAREQRG
jgi:hypothetical protein